MTRVEVFLFGVSFLISNLFSLGTLNTFINSEKYIVRYNDFILKDTKLLS